MNTLRMTYERMTIDYLSKHVWFYFENNPDFYIFLSK